MSYESFEYVALTEQEIEYLERIEDDYYSDWIDDTDFFEDDGDADKYDSP